MWHEVGWQPSCFDGTLCSTVVTAAPWMWGVCSVPRGQSSSSSILPPFFSGLCLIQAKLSEIQETRAIR